MKRWPTKPLGELVDFLGGGTPRRDCAKYWGGDIPWASVKDLQGQSLDTTIETITAEGLANSASNLVPEGTVIIASRVGLGKVAINRKPVAINQDLKALKPRNGELLPRFLLFFLLSNAEYFERAGVGATVKGLTIGDYQKLEMPVPPLEEQGRIVKLLDEADELRKLRAQADRRSADLIPALFHEMFGDINSNDKNWPVVRFAEIGGARLGKMLDAKQQTGKHKRTYLRNANVQWDRFQLDDLLEMDFHEADREEFRLQYGDLLICEGGEVGRAAIWRDELDECYFQKALHRVRMHPSKATPEFALHLLRAIATNNSFRDYVGSATIPHLTGVKLASISIPLPPLPLQQEFAQRVGEIRALQAAQAASRQRTEHLFQSMLHRAFDQAL